MYLSKKHSPCFLDLVTDEWMSWTQLLVGCVRWTEESWLITPSHLYTATTPATDLHTSCCPVRPPAGAGGQGDK